ncbi:uncharacterized protein LOC8263921 isoform X1 [Ricinus communis]|uniref:uncharacterized protein LOC8263921 isoform X1 n=1 Tax=Ricinus communis TaxID=3988 RepID=UPI00201AAA30|nr:uncharacterized protein LOC8263921 isoform X1 [Ricinus communis]
MSLPVVDTEYMKEIDKARRDLRALIAYKNCAPIMLRLAWHDAGTYDKHTKTGGPNGSIRNEEEYSHGSNNGLKIALDFCEEVKAKHPRITYADLYQLAGVVAVEVTGGPSINFVPGRKDSKISPREGRLPDAKQDIKNAFLHGDLQEEVYMEQPLGFVAQGEYGKVFYLRKFLYGLKQRPRAWFGKFSQAVEKFDMKKSKLDHSIFFKHSAVGIILLVVFVDDIVIIGSGTTEISSLKYFLHIQFHTKYLGMLRYLLGVKVIRSKKGIFLSQRKYVLDLLSEIGKLGAKPCNIPIVPNLQLTNDDELFKDLERYRRLVGKLNYLTVTLPDIAYSVSVVSQYMSSSTVNHWTTVEQILCYLKGALGRGILYGNHGYNRIECFLDTDWAGPRMIEDLLQAILYLLEGIWFHGKVRSKMLSHVQMRNQSIEL